MKKIALTLIVIVGCIATSSAQKFALIDMEYILRNLPAYEMANEQLNQASKKWEQELKVQTTAAENLYNDYQSKRVFMDDTQKKRYEEAIVLKEKEVTDLRYKYFGPEGELFKLRQAKIQPIQEDIYEAVKKVAEAGGYQAVFDRASSQSIVFASPRIDISNEVLANLQSSK